MSKHIQLTQGLSVLVDDADYEKFGHLNWKSARSGKKYYAVLNYQSGGKFKRLTLHREIMNPTEGMFVDHINGNPLDCRKENMRLVTGSQNAMNRRLRSDNKLGVVGVSKTKSGKYLAYCSVGGKIKRLGLFVTIEEAVAARKAAEVSYYGEYARSKDRLIEDLPEPKPEHKPNQLHRKRVNNTSGRMGVSFFPRMNAWRARIRLNYKEKTLGYFKTFDEAVAARENAEREYFPEYFKDAA
jgi:hypothetical protein